MINNIYLKIIIIFLVFIVFYLLSNKSIEHFNNKIVSFNDKINYKNTSDLLPWKHHELHSSIPNDIKLKYETAYYYEYSNIEYENRIKKIFNINTKDLISISDGIEWSNWIYPNKELLTEYDTNKLLKMYNEIYKYIEKNIKDNELLKLENDTDDVKIQIVHDIFKKYKKDLNNSDNYLFDFEYLFYRISKIQGKHFKFIINYNKGNIKVIASILLGVVNEDNIILHPVIGNDKQNKKNYSEFKNLYNDINKDNKLLEDIYHDETKLLNDDYVDFTIEQNMYNKLLQEL